MNPQDEATKYGATFTAPKIDDFHALASKYGATYSPAAPIGGNQTSAQPQMPLLTNQSGGFGTALKDEAVGAGKSLIGGAVGVAKGLQWLGQKVGGAFGINTKGSGLKSLDSSTPEGKSVDESLSYKSRAEQTGGVLSDIAQFVSPLAGGNAEKLAMKGKEIYGAYKAGKEAKVTADATEKITEMIAPKATAKEARLAQSQGRFVEGKAPTLFKSGTPDTILPTKKTLSASETIVNKIPNAAKMSPSELYTAVDNNITKTAKELRPQMEKTPIKSETIQKINSEWDTLKKQQISNAPATEEVNVAKRQAKFESLLKKSGSENHADLWDTRVNYDNSISANVKKANSLSPESLQIQKEEWLQNRAILNNAINDNAAGMGTKSQKAFQDMSNLYEAKNNILSKAKVNKEPLPSKAKQFLTNHPVISGAVGGGTLYGAAKKIGVPLP